MSQTKKVSNHCLSCQGGARPQIRYWRPNKELSRLAGVFLEKFDNFIIQPQNQIATTLTFANSLTSTLTFAITLTNTLTFAITLTYTLTFANTLTNTLMFANTLANTLTIYKSDRQQVRKCSLTTGTSNPCRWSSVKSAISLFTSRSSSSRSGPSSSSPLLVTILCHQEKKNEEARQKMAAVNRLREEIQVEL